MTVFLGEFTPTFLRLNSTTQTNSTLMLRPNVYIIRMKRTMFKSLVLLVIKVIEEKMKTRWAEREQTEIIGKEVRERRKKRQRARRI